MRSSSQSVQPVPGELGGGAKLHPDPAAGSVEAGSVLKSVAARRRRGYGATGAGQFLWFARLSPEQRMRQAESPRRGRFATHPRRCRRPDAAFARTCRRTHEGTKSRKVQIGRICPAERRRTELTALAILGILGILACMPRRPRLRFGGLCDGGLGDGNGLGGLKAGVRREAGATSTPIDPWVRRHDIVSLRRVIDASPPGKRVARKHRGEPKWRHLLFEGHV